MSVDKRAHGAAPDGGSRGSKPPVLEGRELVKTFRTGSALAAASSREIVRAVDRIDFELHERKTLSLVGESGCGKTTTAKMLLDLEEPTEGTVRYQGRDIQKLRGDEYTTYRRGVQAVFQDPSSALSPRRRIRQLIAEPLVATRAASRRDAEARAIELMSSVGLDPSFASAFPHELSGGMRQRVAVAAALATQPSVIVLDEPVSALDVSIRAQIMNLLKDVQEEHDVAYALIAHDLATVRYLSDEVAAMYLGVIVERGPSEKFFREAYHPYTLSLISAAIPSGVGRKRERIVLTGEIPSPADPPPGCRFHTRCWLRKSLDDPEICATDIPQMTSVGPRHNVACHFLDESVASPVRAHLLEEIEASVINPATSMKGGDR